MNERLNESPAGRGLGTLISDLAQQVTTLLQTEGKLLRSEMSDKLSKVAAGAIEVLGGAICLLAAGPPEDPVSRQSRAVLTLTI